MAQYVALTLCGSIVSVKKPRKEPSLQCRSAFNGEAIIMAEMLLAAGGVTKLPNGELEVTAVYGRAM